MIAKYNIQGFGLVEVLACLLILSFAVLGLIKLQLTVLESSDYAIRSQQALKIAESKLEYFLGVVRAGDSIPLLESEIPTTSDGENSQGEKVQDYRVEWQVTDNFTLAQVKRIEVMVSWQDRKGIKQQIELSTLLSEY